MGDNDRTLRQGLLANAIFSSLCGLSMVLAAPTLAAWAGLPGPLPLWILGPGLLLFAADLLHQASRPQISRSRALTTTLADLGWVVGSAALLLGWPELLNGAGRIAVIVVAVVVADCALWQGLGLRRLAASPAV